MLGKPNGEILYVDVSQTWDSTLQTGAQRVVKQVVSNLYKSKANFELINFENEEYRILPRTLLENFESIDDADLQRTEAIRRNIFKFALMIYLKLKNYLPSYILMKLLSSRFGLAAKKSLNQKMVPIEFARLDPTNANILLLDFIFNVKQIDYLISIAKSHETNFTLFCYDCNPITSPSYFNNELITVFKQYLKLANYCQKIWSISETSQNDIKSLAKIDPNMISLNYRWLAPFQFPKCQHKNSLINRLKNENYLLMVSTFSQPKNHLGLFVALQTLKARGVTVPQVYLVGGASDGIEEIINAKISELAQSGIQVKKIENLQDCCLGRLYENCLFTIFPSFVEGFGLPIIESLSFGKPVVTANVTSMGELLSLPGTIGFSHTAHPNLAETLEHLLTGSELLKALTEEAFKNKDNLGTWQEYAIALYNFVMEQDK
jgi:glycosyltransferase involved in cell wall biosynthesis